MPPSLALPRRTLAALRLPLPAVRAVLAALAGRSPCSAGPGCGCASRRSSPSSRSPSRADRARGAADRARAAAAARDMTTLDVRIAEPPAARSSPYPIVAGASAPMPDAAARAAHHRPRARRPSRVQAAGRRAASPPTARSCAARRPIGSPRVPDRRHRRRRRLDDRPRRAVAAPPRRRRSCAPGSAAARLGSKGWTASAAQTDRSSCFGERRGPRSGPRRRAVLADRALGAAPPTSTCASPSGRRPAGPRTAATSLTLDLRSRLLRSRYADPPDREFALLHDLLLG